MTYPNLVIKVINRGHASPSEHRCANRCISHGCGGCWRIISIGHRVTFFPKERVRRLRRGEAVCTTRAQCFCILATMAGGEREGEREGVLPCFVIYGCITESGARMVNAWEMPRAGTEVCIKWRSTFLRCHAGLNPLPRSISSLSLLPSPSRVLYNTFF